MRSDAFDQQRELRMKEGWRGRGRGEGEREEEKGWVGREREREREGLDNESCAEDGDGKEDGWRGWWGEIMCC